MNLLLNRPRFALRATESTRSSSKHLEELSFSILMALDNDPTGNPAYKYLATNHQAQFPGDGIKPPTQPILTYTREAFVKLRADAVALHPEIHLEVLDTASSIDDKQSTATVWLRGFLTRYESTDMMTREAVAMLEWRRFEGCDWSCTKSVFTHGYSGIWTRV